MSYTDDFRAFARRHGVSDDAITRILWTVRPSVHLELYRPDEVRPEHRVVGRLGGLPDMPLDAPWYPWDLFIAEIDLAAIPAQPLRDGLPREGRLLLFASTDYWAEDGDPARVIHVSPGTETAVREGPVDPDQEPDGDDDLAPEPDKPFEPVAPQVLVLAEATGWDVLGWTWWDPQDPEGPGDRDDAEREWIAQLRAAIEEYGSRVGHVPVVRRGTGHLGGVELNPWWRGEHGRAFLKRREEAVAVLRDAPERFDEVYGQALREAAGEEGGPWTNLLQFGDDEVMHAGDGEFGWAIPRDDLLAGRFDRVIHQYTS
jgi:hypothetical protein